MTETEIQSLRDLHDWLVEEEGYHRDTGILITLRRIAKWPQDCPFCAARAKVKGGFVTCSQEGCAFHTLYKLGTGSWNMIRMVM